VFTSRHGIAHSFNANAYSIKSVTYVFEHLLPMSPVHTLPEAEGRELAEAAALTPLALLLATIGV